MVNRADLLKHVWDDSSSQSNVIDVYASRVRRKIDDGEVSPLFATLRGVGFMLGAAGDKASKRPGLGRPSRKQA